MGLGLKSIVTDKTNDLIFWFKNIFFRPNLFNLNTPERIGATYFQPSDMCETDCGMLYSLVRGLRPDNALEIGARWGGSARIITNAMEDNNHGFLVSIDPEVKTFRVKPKELHGRHCLIEGFSPDITPEAAKKCDGKLDFVFIDALHIYDAVVADFEGVIPFLSDGSHVLFHDAYHQGVAGAISDVISKDSRFIDCGFITRNPVLGEPVAYQGMRLVRFNTLSDEVLIEQAYKRSSQQVPEFATKYWNYDDYAIRAGIVKLHEPPKRPTD